MTRRIRAALLALLAAVTVTIVVTVSTGPDGKPHGTVTVTLGGPGHKQVTLTPAAQQTLTNVAEQSDGELSRPLREPGDRGPVGVVGGPLATPEFPGCRTRFVRNFSNRTAGARPQVIVWHQTVSHENGWASQDGLTVRANTPTTLVSWHFLIGRSQGRCTYTVPLSKKAWTQGNANSVSVGIEVEAYGDEPSYVTGAGERKLLAVTRRVGKLYGIPMQRGLVRFDSDCHATVVRPGIVEHSELGPCGGGHVDVTPWQTTALIAKLAPRTITHTDVVTCRKLTWWRAHGRPHGKPETNAVRRRKALDGRGVTCTPRGPVRSRA